MVELEEALCLVPVGWAEARQLQRLALDRHLPLTLAQVVVGPDTLPQGTLPVVVAGPVDMLSALLQLLPRLMLMPLAQPVQLAQRVLVAMLVALAQMV
jgi:hypothetical protein